MTKVSQKNNKQDVQFARLDQKVDDFKETFFHFRDNDFSHFRKEVEDKLKSLSNRDWAIVVLVITSILIPLLLRFVF